MVRHRKDLKHILAEYISRNRKSKDMLLSSMSISMDELSDDFVELMNNPSVRGVINFGRDCFGSAAWVTNSYTKMLYTMAGLKKQEPNLLPPEDHEIITQSILNNNPYALKYYSDHEIFNCIYSEIYYDHYDNHYSTPLRAGPIEPTIVLVSGVFNEIYKTAAFEEGVKKMGLKYFVAQVHGFKGTPHNAKIIEKQLGKYIEENPNEKLWLMCYSKGGIDTLHFMAKNRDFCEKHILGFSGFASPILGSNHLDHRVIKVINALHNLSDTKAYKVIDKKIDVLAKEFQNSLTSKNQRPWFKKHHSELPQNPFYTSIALEAEWYESHIYMILTKIFFNSGSINDGVVDAENTLFPHYFSRGINLGIYRGHHLVGARSSSFAQETLIEAHIIFLKYKGLL